jgi:hypothetical protein
MKRMLFEFHNSVNLRKGYHLFHYDELNAKYSTAVTKNILQNFIMFFEDRNNRSIKLIASDLHRSLISNEFKKWINTHIQYFDP